MTIFFCGLQPTAETLYIYASDANTVPVLETVSTCFRSLIMVTEMVIVLLPITQLNISCLANFVIPQQDFNFFSPKNELVNYW